MPKRGKSKFYADLACKRWKKDNASDTVTPLVDSASAVSGEECSTNELNARFKNILLGSQQPIETCDKANRYIIIDVSSLSNLIRRVKCSECNSDSLEIELDNANYGLANKLNLRCNGCEDKGLESVKCSTFTSKKIANEQNQACFDVNLRFTKAFLHFGKGYAAIEQFSIIMNICPFSNRMFNEYQKAIQHATTLSTEKALHYVRCAVKKAYQDEDVIPDPNGNDSMTDIAVSFDGSWLTRGYRSKYGVGCAIDLLTGYVVDFAIMSKYCHMCEAARRDLGPDSAEFEVWSGGHAQECQINHSGSSGAMEMSAAAEIWQRSVQWRLRYRTMLSDGDSKTFLHLQGLRVYGPEVPIEKEECVNHVSKRLGTGLRNTVKEWRFRGVTLGGRGRGTLKDTTIQKLQEYYKKAIYRNKRNEREMKSAILATIYHAVSTDEKPVILFSTYISRKQNRNT